MFRSLTAFKATLFAGMIAAGCLTAQAATTTIANWRFEGSVASLGDDSSGNGFNLADPSYTVQYSTTEYAPGTGSTGSAYFDGTNFLATLSSIDLTPYQGQNLRLSFWIKNETPQDANTAGGLGTIFETGANFKSYTGGMYAGVNGTYTDCSNCGFSGMMMPSAVNADQLPHNIYTGSNGVWEHFAIEFRPDAAGAADVTKVYKNGVLMADTVVNGGHATNSANFFRNEYMYLGMRSATPAYAFNGKLDDVQIYDGESGNLVAEWLFEDGAFLSDTSGNGNDLAMSGTYTGVSTSSDVMSGQTGTCAAFDGNGMLSTSSTLDLSSYHKLRIKYRIKEETMANTVGIFMEHSTNGLARNGGFVMSSEELTGGLGCASIQLAPGAKTDRNIDTLNVTSGEWIDYEVVYDQTADNYEDVVVITKNGVVQPDATIADRQGVPTPAVVPMPYPNQKVFVGARNGTAYNYIGYIDNLKLEAFTDGGSTLPGDANGDYVVNQLDAQALAENWLKQVGATWSEGDFNGDNKVDDTDATIMAANWLKTATPPTAVPEPGCIAILAAGLLALLALQRRR